MHLKVEDYDLVLVEGLWNVGKTTSCKKLKNKYGFLFISEPDHKKLQVNVSDVQSFYLKEHFMNLSSAIDLVKHGNKVVVERTVFSTVVFNSVLNNKSLDCFSSDILKFNLKINEIIKTKKVCVLLLKRNLLNVIDLKNISILNGISIENMFSMEIALENILNKQHSCDIISSDLNSLWKKK